MHNILWKHKTNVGDKKNHFEAARKEAEEFNKKGANQNTEKNVAKAVAKQKCITSYFAKESERMILKKWKKMWKILTM